MFDRTTTDAVLWDLDDTLYSRLDAARRVFVPMFRDLLYVNRDDAFLQAAADCMMTHVTSDSMIHKEAFEQTLAAFPPDRPFDHDACVEYYYAHISEYAVPSATAMEIVKKLRQMGVKNAIVTNCWRVDAQQRKLDALKIAPYFDEILLSGVCGVHKPDRRIYDLCTQKLGVANSRCLFVGDSAATDITGALNAGMRSVWLNVWNAENCFTDKPSVTMVHKLDEFFQF